MAENLIISDGTKEQKYQTLLQQVIALAENESDTIALMANISSMIHHTFGFFWTGFWRRTGPRTLPRTSGMYKDKVRTRRLRDIMEEGRNGHRS